MPIPRNVWEVLEEPQGECFEWVGLGSRWSLSSSQFYSSGVLGSHSVISEVVIGTTMQNSPQKDKGQGRELHPKGDGVIQNQSRMSLGTQN